MISDEELVKKIKKDRAATDAGLSRQRQNIKECRMFYDGDFMEYLDTIQFKDQYGKKKKALVQINKVKPYVNAVAGHFAQNRRQPKYIAVMQEEAQQVALSKYANALSTYCRGNTFADQAETEQDYDMLIGGVGVVETALSFEVGNSSNDENASIIIASHDILSVGWDSTATRKNLMDRRFEYIVKKYDLDEALELFDGSEETDFDTDGGETEAGFTYAPGLGGNYDRVRYDWANKADKEIYVTFYNWYETQTFYRADNPLFKSNNPEFVQIVALELKRIGEEFDFDWQAEQLNFSAEAKAEIKAMLGGQIKTYPFKRKCFYSAVVSGDKVFYKQKSISQAGFPLKFKTGDRDNTNGIWVCMVQSMKDPALYYNKALTELMFTIAANSKGGVMWETGAIHDVATFERDYAKTDASVEVADGALTGGKIQPKKTPHVATGHEQIIAFSDANFADVTGIDKTFLGSSENKMEPAALQRQRIRQVMTVLANYADSIVMHSKDHARLMLDYMRAWAEVNEGGVFKILGQKGKIEFERVSADKMNAEFTIDIQDAPQTADEKQENAQTLMQIATPLLSVGDPSGKIVIAKAIKYMNLDAEDVQEISKALVPEQGQIDPAYVQQLEQALQQAQGAMTEAQVAALQSKAALDRAKIPQIMADAKKKAAETQETVMTAEQVGIENTILRHTGQKNVDFHI